MYNFFIITIDSIFNNNIVYKNFSSPLTVTKCSWQTSFTGEKEWDVLYERYLAELNAQEKIKMLKGLTSTKELWIANR